MQKIFKILTIDQWFKFQQTGAFNGSEHDLRDGYIHLCFKKQLARTIEKYFKQYKTVYVIEIKLKKSDTKLKLEASSGGEVFPHYYGELILSQIEVNASMVETG
jgi:uncharacterized protein (DUF952 family)